MSATTASTLLAKSSRVLPKWANTLLVVVLGWALAVLTLNLLPRPALELAPVAVTGVAHAAGPSVEQMGGNIASLNLFGNPAKAPVETTIVEPTKPVVDTKLPLQLAGVFDYRPAERAIAIIEDTNKKEQGAFGIGDKVIGETTLKSVHSNYIILSRNGKDERLQLPENVQPIAMRPIQQQPTASASNNASVDPNAPVDLPQQPGELRDMLAKNPAVLGRVVAAEPYQENGKLVGYRITPKQNPEILEAQGILSGDVITRVNNIQLNSQKQGVRALRNAVKAQQLDVTILRDGIEVPISINLSQ
ncbi:MAG: hypothetical protein KTR35_00895 [Gammaproteobacteria bacterium]|nr:hypothetical protein [Gammaproteobacteria bacterium]